MVGPGRAPDHPSTRGEARWPAATGLLLVGVFGLAAYNPFLLGGLTSKLADLLVVGVLACGLRPPPRRRAPPRSTSQAR